MKGFPPITYQISPKSTRTGAYGVALLEGFGAEGMISCPESWPVAHLRQVCTPTGDPRFQLDEASATVPLLGGGCWYLERDGLMGALHFHRPLEPDELAHPALAGAACVLAYWLGHEIFHSGGFVLDGRAWGVLGEKAAGKTTLLASLSAWNHQIIADDMLVVNPRRQVAMAGPRTLDLRPDVARLVGTTATVVRNKERHRITLDEIQPEIPLGGWISLNAGQAFSVETVPPRDRISRLAIQRTLKVMPTDPTAMLELARLPFIEVTRPLIWEETHSVVAGLLDAARKAQSD